MTPEPFRDPPSFDSFTFVLPVFNEEARVGRVVDYYARFAPLVVVDNFSTDRTGAIARERGARVVQFRNAGTPQTTEWFRHAASLVETDYFAMLSCSEFLPATLLARYDEVARARSAGVVANTRRIVTAGEELPGFWDDATVERFYSKLELDFDAIVIHGSFAPLRPERLLVLPPEPRWTSTHLRDFDAVALVRKVTDYAVVEAGDRARRGMPLGAPWLLKAWLYEAWRILRLGRGSRTRVALREAWARAVMHSITWWVGWELREGRGIAWSRAQSEALWNRLASVDPT